MFGTTKTKGKQQSAKAKATTTTQFRTGPDPKGPTKCIKCHKPFKKGETWRRLTSPVDPEHGSYAIGIHDKCSQQEQPRGA